MARKYQPGKPVCKKRSSTLPTRMRAFYETVNRITGGPPRFLNGGIHPAWMRYDFSKPAVPLSARSSLSPKSSASQRACQCRASSETSYSETEEFQRIESLKAIDIEPDLQADFERIGFWAGELPQTFEKMKEDKPTTISNETPMSGQEWFDNNNRVFAITGLPPRNYSTPDDRYLATRYKPQLRLRVSAPVGMKRMTLKFCGRTVASGFVSKTPPKKKNKSRRTW
jgi:hypothetical protein